MNDTNLTQKDIENKIFTVRNIQVILDKDLAIFYEVKPIRLREQVKRNLNRFPEDFMFQLSDEEVDSLVSQNAIPSKKYLGGSRPYVFTEQGVAAVSAVIKNNKSAFVSILIMRAFVNMRRFLMQNISLFQRIGRLELKQAETDSKIDDILKALQPKDNGLTQGVFFNGQIGNKRLSSKKFFNSNFSRCCCLQFF